jgi:hypothetical protein
MATIDDDLARFERDIRQLKIEYDQFFGGGRKRPPSEIEWRLDTMVKRYSERGGDLNFAQRFRYNNLVQTYAKYKDIFRKRVQQHEEGRSQRHFGAAAKAIEAERAKRQAEAEAAQPPVAASVATAPVASVQPEGFRVVCSDPENEIHKVEQLYKAFLEAKLKAGEETTKLTRPAFNEFLRRKTQDLQKKQNCRDVEYVVEVIEGQVKLKALVKN